MKIHCGRTTFDQTIAGRIHVELKYLSLPKGKVCIGKDGIANLLFVGKLVKERYQVTMDSDVENTINVFNEDGSYIKFVYV